MARGDLTDDEWALVEPHLPPLGERGPIPDLRRQFNAVMWRFRTGSPWRDVPVEYGSWSTIYDRFHAWALQGVFAHLMEQMIALAASRGQVDLGLVSVDSTMPHAHHHAAGMRLDAELLAELEKAATEEKGVRDRHKRRTTRSVTPPRRRPARGADSSDAATGPG